MTGASLDEPSAQRFRVLAEPMRTKLLDYLGDGDATVTELQQAIGASRQNVLKHVGILHDAAMVTHIKDGNHVRYPIADEGVFELREQASRRRYAANSTSSTRSHSPAPAHRIGSQASPGAPRRCARNGPSIGVR